jgi:hypothetical protein
MKAIILSLIQYLVTGIHSLAASFGGHSANFQKDHAAPVSAFKLFSCATTTSEYAMR